MQIYKNIQLSSVFIMKQFRLTCATPLNIPKLSLILCFPYKWNGFNLYVASS